MCSSCVTLPCLYFNHQISTLANIIISQWQYNLGRNHLHSNSQVRIPSRIGCFHEINMLHYRWWGSTHTRPHRTRHQRKIAASMWGHRRNTRHSGVWGLGPCRARFTREGAFSYWDDTMNCSSHLLLLWHSFLHLYNISLYIFIIVQSPSVHHSSLLPFFCVNLSLISSFLAFFCLYVILF